MNQPYSPALLEERVFQDGPSSVLSLLSRVVQLSTELVSFAFKLYFDRLSGVEDDQDLVKQRATELRDMLTRLGPTFIKAGQVRRRRRLPSTLSTLPSTSHVHPIPRARSLRCSRTGQISCVRTT